MKVVTTGTSTWPDLKQLEIYVCRLLTAAVEAERTRIRSAVKALLIDSTTNMETARHNMALAEVLKVIGD